MGLDLNKLIEQDKARWAMCKDAAEKNDVELFWRLYADYLEDSTTISESRKILIKMARSVADIFTCKVNPVLSRVCEKGTKCCEVKHDI